MPQHVGEGTSVQRGVSSRSGGSAGGGDEGSTARESGDGTATRKGRSATDISENCSLVGSLRECPEEEVIQPIAKHPSPTARAFHSWWTYRRVYTLLIYQALHKHDSSISSSKDHFHKSVLSVAKEAGGNTAGQLR